MGTPFGPRSRRAAPAAAGFVCALAAVGLGAAVGGCARSALDELGAGGSLRTALAAGAGARTTLTSGSLGAGTTFASAGVRGGAGLSMTSPDTPVDRLLPEGARPLAGSGLCPPDMASIEDRFCVDRWEASLLEILPDGNEVAFAPYGGPEGHVVRAVSEPGVVPQAHVSGVQAEEACRRSGKRLCKPREWKTACRGPEDAQFGYGREREERRCNDHGTSPMMRKFGRFAPSPSAPAKEQAAFWSWDRMNDTDLNQMSETVALTGSHEGCTNGYGVHDMVGNLHEWVDDPAGTFQGGYYLDTQKNGDGCGYRTDAHEFAYHDYSTGFRCCADVAP